MRAEHRVADRCGRGVAHAAEAEEQRGSEASSYLRLIDFCITQSCQLARTLPTDGVASNMSIV